MSTQFTQDLFLARRRAGLTQKDCARLLGINKSRINELERGKRIPTLTQLCQLSLVYDRSFESLITELLQTFRNEMLERLKTLPKERRVTAKTFQRSYHLKKLTKRLAALPQKNDIT